MTFKKYTGLRKIPSLVSVVPNKLISVKFPAGLGLIITVQTGAVSFGWLNKTSFFTSFVIIKSSKSKTKKKLEKFLKFVDRICK